MSDITIIGRNEHGEVVTETITEDMLNDPLGFISKEKYATLGIEPTFNESMEDLRLACGRLMIALLQGAARLALLPLRFLMWLNGVE